MYRGIASNANGSITTSVTPNTFVGTTIVAATAGQHFRLASIVLAGQDGNTAPIRVRIQDGVTVYVAFLILGVGSTIVFVPPEPGIIWNTGTALIIGNSSTAASQVLWYTALYYKEPP